MTTEMIERILSKENLEEAKCKVMSNKGSAGVDRMKPVSYRSLLKRTGKNCVKQYGEGNTNPYP